MSTVNSVAVELNSDASALMSADNMPASTRPRRPIGSRFDTSTGKALCGFVPMFSKPGAPCFHSATAIMPGNRKMNTGASLR